MKKSVRANLLLAVTALIWGIAFVAQDVAGDTLGAFTFNGLRMALAALALLPVVMAMDRRAMRSGTADMQNTGAGVPFRLMTHTQRRTLLAGGVCCGVILALGSAFQQIGISLGTGAGKAGFITALYIVLVPVLGLFLRRPVRLSVWLAVALSVAGLYLLCIGEGFVIEKGDLLMILCALCFAAHILVIDFFSRRTDCVKMSCIQFAVVAVLCLTAAAASESISLEAIKDCAIPIIYAGVMSGAVGYTLQIVAQKDTDPTVASLIMSLESVFAVAAGWVILGDALTLREWLGCAAMMGGIVLAQLPSSAKAAKTARRHDTEM